MIREPFDEENPEVEILEDDEFIPVPDIELDDLEDGEVPNLDEEELE